MVMSKKKRVAWIVSADMGYGHQRAAFALKDIAFKKIFTANSDEILTDKERKSWNKLRTFYELVSKYSSFPFIGKFLFNLYDYFQSIAHYYPRRDLSRPTIPAKYFDYLIRKKELCHSITEYVKTEDIPMITTFHITAIAADKAGVKNVYCILTDTDINRVWVAKDPNESRIKYLAPCERVVNRLKEYGVKDEKIIFTGFPLPKENIGNKSLNILKKDFKRRLSILDPNKRFYRKYKETINKRLRMRNLNKRTDPPVLTFSIGGAGAQIEIASRIMHSLKHKILTKKIILNIVVGMHFDYFTILESEAKKAGLTKKLGKGLNIISSLNRKSYFEQFSKILRTTDILWTKPSELSFYTALGIPIIMSPTIGAHENHNRDWLFEIGAGIDQNHVDYTDEWLFDMINSGRFAEAAWNGFLNAPKKGTYNIEKVVFVEKR